MTKLWSKFFDLYLIFCLSCIEISFGLHEDQAGVNDWRLRLVGRPSEILLPEKSTGLRSLGFVYTDQHVVAALDLKNGEIVWRQVLEGSSAGAIVSGMLTNDDMCVLVNDGRILRCFDQQTGGFNWEFLLASKSSQTGTCRVISISRTDSNIICAIDDRIVALSSKQGNVFWERKQEESSRCLIFEGESTDIVVVSFRTSSISFQKLSPVTGDMQGAVINIPTNEVDLISARCEYVHAVDLDSPFLICYSTSGAGSIISISVSSNNDILTVSSLESLGFEGQPLKNPNFILLKSKSLFTLESTGVSYLFHVARNGQITLAGKGVAASYGLLNEIVLSKNENNQQVTVMLAKVNADGTLVHQAETTRSIPFPSAFGLLKSIKVLSINTAVGVIPSFLFWTEGDVLGLISSGTVVWKREEGLAYVSVTAILDLPISDIEALVEEEFQEKGSFLIRFGKRVISQGLQLQKFFELAVNRLLTGLKTGKFFQKELLERDYFNTQKLIVGVTDTGKVFGLDSRNGEVIYSLIIPNFVKPAVRRIHFYLQRSGAHKPFPSQAVVIGEHKKTGNGLLFFFDCMTGEMLQDPIHLSKPVIQSGMIPVMTSNHLESVFVLEKDLSLTVYPDFNTPDVQNFLFNTLHIVDIDPISGVARGFRVKRINKVNKAQEIWTSPLAAPGEEILAVTPKRPHDSVHSQGRVLADRRVLYKYINPNLVAVTIQGTDESKKQFLKVVAIDGVTGRIVMNTVHRRARGPVHVAHAEHWIMYSYWNEKSRANEITVVEFYRGFDKPNTTYFSSLESLEKPEVSSASFKLPGSITAMADTVTVEGMTHKAIIVALTSGSIMNIPKIFLDPRRPMIPTQAEREEGLIPYAPELPLITENIMNYYQKVERTRGISTGVAGLESISLVFVFGLDLFFTRVTPSALFDVLSDSFDYWILSVVMLVMTIASLIVRNLANAKALNHAWK